MSEYQPELGQMIFGQPSKQYECPQILDAALVFIREELQRVLWNLRQRGLDPFGNEGSSFRCDGFCVCSYSWGDDAQPWNFKHYKSGIEVSWYKYAGRGQSVNREVTPDEASALLTDCIEWLRKVESGAAQYTEPGLYPEGALPDDHT